MKIFKTPRTSSTTTPRTSKASKTEKTVKAMRKATIPDRVTLRITEEMAGPIGKLRTEMSNIQRFSDLIEDGRARRGGEHFTLGTVVRLLCELSLEIETPKLCQALVKMVARRAAAAKSAAVAPKAKARKSA